MMSLLHHQSVFIQNTCFCADLIKSQREQTHWHVKKKNIRGFYYRLALPYDVHRRAEQMWIICCLYNHVTSASGSTTLEGYRDVGVSLSFTVAPDNWLRSLERLWLTLLVGEKEDGGMTVRMRLSERRGKVGGAPTKLCMCFNTLSCLVFLSTRASQMLWRHTLR